jgi:hypothetical protein
VKGKTVSSPSSLSSQHTGVDNTTHGSNKLLRDSRSVRLDNISRTESISSQNIALGTSSLVGNKCDMSRTSGVSLDTVDNAGTGFEAPEVDGTDTTLSTSSMVTNGDTSSMVTTSLSMSLLREG